MTGVTQANELLPCAEKRVAVLLQSGGLDSRARRTSGEWNDAPTRAVSAARRILERDGYDALTLEAINREAGISNKTMARYYFGNKEALVDLAMRHMIEEYFAGQLPALPAEATLPERIDAFIEALREMHSAQRRYLGFLTILPHMVRKESLRRELEVAHNERRARFIAALLPSEGAGEQDDDLQALADLAAAAYDGLAVQAMIHGAVRNLEHILGNVRALLLLAAQAAPASCVG